MSALKAAARQFVVPSRREQEGASNNTAARNLKEEFTPPLPVAQVVAKVALRFYRILLADSNCDWSTLFKRSNELYPVSLQCGYVPGFLRSSSHDLTLHIVGA